MAQAAETAALFAALDKYVLPMGKYMADQATKGDGKVAIEDAKEHLAGLHPGIKKKNIPHEAILDIISKLNGQGFGTPAITVGGRTFKRVRLTSHLVASILAHGNITMGWEAHPLNSWQYFQLSK
jgi:hypothetical protein